jgi:hypothetical protein
MGRIESCILKLGNMLKKNQAIYKLYSEDIAIAKQDYFYAQLICLAILAKCQKYASSHKKKAVVLWFVKCTN